MPAAFLRQYAASFAAPIIEHTTVRRVFRDAGGFTVATDRGTLRSANVVVATGWCDRPTVLRSASSCHGTSTKFRRASTATRPVRLREECSSSVLRQPACSSPRNCTPVGTTSPLRSATTAACLARIGGSTSSGGWTTSERSTRPSTKPTTRARREQRPRCSCSGVPGAFVIGQRFQHYRNSSFIDGVGRDAAHIARQLSSRPTRAGARFRHPAQK